LLIFDRFGWFWECPSGQDCKYRHALPPGFVLKAQRKALDDAAKANVISLEDFLETERHKLGPNLTPVTPESFAKWKQTRINQKTAAEEALKKAKDAQAAAGKSSGMSGRDLVRVCLLGACAAVDVVCSSNTIRIGSRTTTTKRTTGTSTSTGRSRRTTTIRERTKTKTTGRRKAGRLRGRPA
jgi:hypothetical protein